MSEGDPFGQALQAALRLLATREHSREELYRKLTRRFPCRVVEQALEQLAEEGAQSDVRFAEAYVRSRVEKGWGPLRIRAELRERGLADVLVEQALAEAEVDWSARLEQLIRRKYGDGPPADRREVARRARFLAARGFPDALIRDRLFS